MCKVGLIYPNLNYQGKYEVNGAYVDYFSKFGEIVPITPECPYVEDIDVLVLTGGADINPIRYGDFPKESGAPNLEYDYFEQVMLSLYIDANIPIVGICRGMQALFVHYGGKLNQHEDLPTSTSKGNYLTQHLNMGSRGKIVEHLKLTPSFNHLKKLKKVNLGINSLHHQTANLKTMPKEIVPIGYSEENKNLELFTVKNKNILAFQGHVEELSNTKLFDHLIKNTINGKLANWN
jgi:putative glutamine amidotransferase